MDIGIIGGTGPAGRGLAVRLAAVGHQVSLGSRDAARAEVVVSELLGRSRPLSGQVRAVSNEDAAQAGMVIVATPWDSALATVKPLAEALRDKVVISMVNALMKSGKELWPLYPPQGSMAAAVASVLPASKLVGAFHHLPAASMEDLDSGLEADVLVCGDDREAVASVVELSSSMEGLRGLDAGSLVQAGAIEAFTATCITINIRHRVHSSLRLSGLDA
ncbi:MAG: NADPH-dependent F420 reductase [Actinomycetota bacterium]